MDNLSNNANQLPNTINNRFQAMGQNVGNYFQNMGQNIGNQFQNMRQNVGNQFQNMGQNIGQNVDNFMNESNYIGNPFNNFEKGQGVEGSKSFLKSNSLLAKLAFIILVVIVFFLLLKLGIFILGLIFQPNKNPILIDGMIDAKHSMVIPQDPKKSNSIPIMRSKNKEDGIEFTWSTWLYVDDFNYKNDQYRHIFHKGNDNMHYDGDQIGLNFPNNSPGLYLAPHTNELLVIMNSFKTIKEEIKIKNIPAKKWIHVVIRCRQKNVDVFVNGKLVRRHVLDGVPKQNYGDVFVSLNGGFDGYTSSLRYYNYAINLREINSLVNSGPNIKPAKTVSI